MTILYTDDRFLNHETGTHRECPERLIAIREELKKSGLAAKCQTNETRIATAEELSKIHGGMYAIEWHAMRMKGAGGLNPIRSCRGNPSTSPVVRPVQVSPRSMQ